MLLLAMMMLGPARRELENSLPFWVWLTFYALIGAGMLLGWVLVRRRQRRIDRLAAPQDPAFEIPSLLEIRRDPERWLAVMRGRVDLIVTTSAPEFQDLRGRGGGGISARFHSFLIDTHGEAHDLETGGDLLAVERNARWLADQLGVRFDYRA